MPTKYITQINFTDEDKQKIEALVEVLKANGVKDFRVMEDNDNNAVVSATTGLFF